jgi:hypothetical protein
VREKADRGWGFQGKPEELTVDTGQSSLSRSLAVNVIIMRIDSDRVIDQGARFEPWWSIDSIRILPLLSSSLPSHPVDHDEVKSWVRRSASPIQLQPSPPHTTMCHPTASSLSTELPDH